MIQRLERMRTNDRCIITDQYMICFDRINNYYFLTGTETSNSPVPFRIGDHLNDDGTIDYVGLWEDIKKRAYPLWNKVSCNVFLSTFVRSFGTLHIDESVFAFILNRKSGQFLNSGIEHHDRHLVWQLMPSGISHTGVECCLSELWQSRATDSINELLHTFFVQLTPFLGQGWIR